MLFKQREFRGVKLSKDMYKCNMFMFIYFYFLLRSKVAVYFCFTCTFVD